MTAIASASAGTLRALEAAGHASLHVYDLTCPVCDLAQREAAAPAWTTMGYRVAGLGSSAELDYLAALALSSGAAGIPCDGSLA